MIGNPGLVRFVEMVAFLNQNTEYEELELVKHAFLPNRWCIGIADKSRWVQAAVINDGTVFEIDYMLEGVGNRTITVLDEGSVAKRVLSYLRKEVDSI